MFCLLLLTLETELSSCTARRKQGGSQAANDNAKGNAKSAGAALRRYNESALTDVSSFTGSDLAIGCLS